MNRLGTSKPALGRTVLIVIVAAFAGACGSLAPRPARSAPPPSVVAAPIQVAHTGEGSAFLGQRDRQSSR